MAKCYKDYLSAEIERVTSKTKAARSYKRYLRYAKTINREQMLDCEAELTNENGIIQLYE